MVKVLCGTTDILKVPYCTPFWSFILGFDVLKSTVYFAVKKKKSWANLKF